MEDSTNESPRSKTINRLKAVALVNDRIVSDYLKKTSPKARTIDDKRWFDQLANRTAKLLEKLIDRGDAGYGNLADALFLTRDRQLGLTDRANAASRALALVSALELFTKQTNAHPEDRPFQNFPEFRSLLSRMSDQETFVMALRDAQDALNMHIRLLVHALDEHIKVDERTEVDQFALSEEIFEIMARLSNLQNLANGHAVRIGEYRTQLNTGRKRARRADLISLDDKLDAVLGAASGQDLGVAGRSRGGRPGISKGGLSQTIKKVFGNLAYLREVYARLGRDHVREELLKHEKLRSPPGTSP